MQRISTASAPRKQTLLDTNLNVDFYPDFLDEKAATTLAETLEKEVSWSQAVTSSRRINCFFGNKGSTYEVEYKGEKYSREAVPWEQCPALIAVRDAVTKLTGETYNFCVVQRYPHGVGIAPHRDKEMIKGTTIAGVSLVTTRVLTMANFQKSHQISLNPGSLYVLNSPTNSYWTHCIEKEPSTGVRISLTFRNYEVPPPKVERGVAKAPAPVEAKPFEFPTDMFQKLLAAVGKK